MQIIEVHPLSFTEFLQANHQSPLSDVLVSGSWDLIGSFKLQLIEQLRLYFYVGGMPEVVSVFTDTKSLQEARELQLQILRDYRFDISKHLPTSDVENALAVIDSIPAHLGRENKKFIFSQIRKGALTEQFVCQQLISEFGLTPYYWSSESARSEVDFLIQSGTSIYPIEVKAAENLRSKSLRVFFEQHPSAKPKRFSLSDYRQQDWMQNIPLYSLVSGVPEVRNLLSN